MPNFIDTHAHLYKEYYEDIDEVIKRSKELGIEYIISDGDYLETNIEMLELADKYQNVFITLGFHPEFINNYKTEDLDVITNNINNPKVIAIGEIGLDYHYDNYDKDSQIKLFESQLKLAEKFHMPVVVHSRDATKDTIDTLKKFKVKGVIHCFSGSLETAKEYIKMGYKLGVGGTVTFHNSKLIEIIKEIGPENIILETDSPFLSPVPFRGQKNIPGNVKYVADFLSENLNISLEELSKITEENVKETFPKFNN